MPTNNGISGLSERADSDRSISRPFATGTEPPAQQVLALHNISHIYPGSLRTGAVLKDVSLHLNRGEIVCLVGPSGCGKSTLLRLAAGLESVQAGSILLNGETIADPWHQMPPEKRGIGMVFQDYALFPHLSVLDNVCFGLTRLSAMARKERGREALRQVGMERLEGAWPHALSGGQQQRVALARALAPHPAVLLLDEPFSGLDTRLREQVRDQTLHVLKRNGVATLLVTHDPEEAMFLADRIVLMQAGRVVQEGTPTALYTAPVSPFAAGFFGDINTLSGTIENGMIHSPFGPLPAPPDLACQTAVQVLIRPEGFHLNPLIRPCHPSPDVTDLLPAALHPRGHVVMARPLGRSCLVQVALATESEHKVHLHARIPGHLTLETGTELTVSLDHRYVFIFPTSI